VFRIAKVLKKRNPTKNIIHFQKKSYICSRLKKVAIRFVLYMKQLKIKAFYGFV